MAAWSLPSGVQRTRKRPGRMLTALRSRRKGEERKRAVLARMNGREARSRKRDHDRGDEKCVRDLSLRP